MELVPISRSEARRFIASHHRHNEPPYGYKFAIGLRRDEELIGVVVAEVPKARLMNDGWTLEVSRVTTIGDRNACSRLYGAACRAAAALGYRRVITYTLADESGASLRAAAFVADGQSAGGEWGRHNRVGALDRLRLFDPPKVPTGPKTRWVRELIPNRQPPTLQEPDAA